MICKDCEHYLLCANDITNTYEDCKNKNDVEKRCLYFKDKSTTLDLPCKVGDTVYAIPSLAIFRLNVLHGLSENNRVCKQKVHSVQMWDPVEWCIWTCDGIALLPQRNYKKTWFLTKAEAEKALEVMNNEKTNN